MMALTALTALSGEFEEGVPPTPAAGPELDFSDTDNSQFIPLL